MKGVSYVIPALIIILFIAAAFKKVKLYDTFTEGAKEAVPLAVSIFPYLVSIFVLTEIFEKSGVSKIIIDFLSPFFGICGIPKELTKLILLKPFSGSGSLALLTEIYTSYGADSYIGRCASVIYGSSETIFYVSAVYFTRAKNKRLLKPILISIAATFISYVFACFICLIL